MQSSTKRPQGVAYTEDGAIDANYYVEKLNIHPDFVTELENAVKGKRLLFASHVCAWLVRATHSWMKNECFDKMLVLTTAVVASYTTSTRYALVTARVGCVECVYSCMIATELPLVCMNAAQLSIWISRSIILCAADAALQPKPKKNTSWAVASAKLQPIIEEQQKQLLKEIEEVRVEERCANQWLITTIYIIFIAGVISNSWRHWLF